LQAGTPGRQNRRNVIGIFFGDEVIESCLGFGQQGIEGPGTAIPRVQVKIAFCRGAGGI
jgi:hypothetical protein